MIVKNAHFVANFRIQFSSILIIFSNPPELFGYFIFIQIRTVSNVKFGHKMSNSRSFQRKLHEFRTKINGLSHLRNI